MTEVKFYVNDKPHNESRDNAEVHFKVNNSWVCIDDVGSVLVVEHGVEKYRTNDVQAALAWVKCFGV